MAHPLANMAFDVFGIVTQWMKENPPGILSEYMVSLMLEDEGLDPREVHECLNLLKNYGYFYSPHIGKIALVR